MGDSHGHCLCSSTAHRLLRHQSAGEGRTPDGRIALDPGEGEGCQDIGCERNVHVFQFDDELESERHRIDQQQRGIALAGSEGRE